MYKIIGFIFKPEILIWGLLVILLLVGHFIFKFSFCSIKDIVLNHIACFRNRKGKLLIVPVIYYFGVPALLAIGAVLFKNVNKDIINVITIIVSIITAMLFTLLSTIIEMKAKINQNPSYYSMEAISSKRALIETYHTVMFEILVSVLILILCLLNIVINKYGIIQSFCIYFLTFVLFLNLLIILKRIYKVIDADMEK